jgi:glycerol-3-phosphate dehydrogenase (NAD(P)+)
MNMVAEGYPASKGIFEINQQLNAHLPIATAIYQILWENRLPADAFAEIEKWLR